MKQFSHGGGWEKCSGEIQRKENKKKKKMMKQLAETSFKI